MSRTFYIDRLGARNTSYNYDKILTDDILKDICHRLTGQETYNVHWNEQHNVGRLIYLIDDETGMKHYINISKYGSETNYRNSYFQSIPTAIGIAFNESSHHAFDFSYYFMPKYEGNIFTGYHKFFYRIMRTIGVKFINYDSVAVNDDIIEFNSLADIINERNRLRGRNSGNNSTFIEEDDDVYNIYGKTFGANAKETVLLCMALVHIAQKPIRLYQIIDNESSSLSANDIKSIKFFSDKEKGYGIDVLEDSYEFSEIFKSDNLRNPRFIYNLLAKTDGARKCAICDCHINKIIQGAHIYPISAIKNNSDLTDEQKMQFATDGDNGLWLCENHHKLFDSGLIKFEKGNVVYNLDKLRGNGDINNDVSYLDDITKYKEIPSELYNNNMERYFELRYDN